MTQRSIKIAIISNHQIFSNALGFYLGDSSLVEAPKEEAEVLIVDVEDGFGELVGMAQPTIALGRHDDPLYAAHALMAGAKAYIHGGEATRTLVDTVRAVAEGAYQPSEAVTDLAKKGGPVGMITPRERQVLEGIAQGLTNSEIATQLGIGVKTIDTHRGHLVKKLRLRNNADITRFALRYGIVANDLRTT